MTNDFCENLADSCSIDTWSIKSTSDDTSSIQSSVLSFINLSNRVKPKVLSQKPRIKEIWKNQKETDNEIGSQMSLKWSKYLCDKSLHLVNEKECSKVKFKNLILIDIIGILFKS